MNRPFSFSNYEYYHLYQRGNEKRQIFCDPGDYWRFLSLLYLTNTTQTIHLSDFAGANDKAKVFSFPKPDRLVSIGAYCLMPNHFHLLVRQEKDGGVSKFMQKLVTAYSMYFNKKNQRTGSLLEGPFRAKQVVDDGYLRYLFAYIHLNPVKIKDPEGWGGKRINNSSLAREFLQDFRFSSFQSYQGQRRIESNIINQESFPGYFSDFKEFGDFINEWINFDDDPNVKVSP